jgi:hypothetical protein
MVQGVQIKDGIIQNINPSTGQPIHPPVSVTTPDQLYHILQTANTSQNDWSDLPLSTRISLLRKSMSAVEQIADNLVGIITEEMGKVPSEAAQEVQNAIALKGEWLDLIQEANEDIHLGGDDDNNNAPESILTRDPYGVVAVLSPWNFPAGEIPLLVLPALAAGNCVVVKPSEVTPLSGEMIVNAMASALPRGVLQVVQGDGSVGELLVKSEDVHMIAMTGSCETGKRILEGCAKSLKRVVLELGGKDPMVSYLLYNRLVLFGCFCLLIPTLVATDCICRRRPRQGGKRRGNKLPLQRRSSLLLRRTSLRRTIHPNSIRTKGRGIGQGMESGQSPCEGCQGRSYGESDSIEYSARSGGESCGFRSQSIVSE